MDGLRKGNTLSFGVYKVICHCECCTDRTFFFSIESLARAKRGEGPILPILFFLLLSLFAVKTYAFHVSNRVFFKIHKIYGTVGHHYRENRAPKSGHMDLYQKSGNSKPIVYTKVQYLPALSTVSSWHSSHTVEVSLDSYPGRTAARKRGVQTFQHTSPPSNIFHTSTKVRIQKRLITPIPTFLDNAPLKQGLIDHLYTE